MTKKEKKLIVAAALQDLPKRLKLKAARKAAASTRMKIYNLAVKSGTLKPTPAARIRRSDGSIL